MPNSASFASVSYTQYLAAKKSIDDRALNPRVWAELRNAISAVARPRVLEVGCGIGTMLERMIERDVLNTAEYLGLDLLDLNILEAQARVAGWAHDHRYSVTVSSDGLHLEAPGRSIRAHFAQADVTRVANQPGGWDLLVAHALLDLVDVPTALRALLPLLKPRALFYFSLVFDGTTHFEPVLDQALDAHIEQAYHQTMDRRAVAGRPSGHSRSGRLLLSLLQQAGGRILEAGSSDWIVFPHDGAYLPEETVLLTHILATIQRALADHPELDGRDLQRWLGQRREQMDRAELAYLAHQLDFLGEYSPPA